MIDPTALRDVADTMYACREWFDSHGILCAAADLLVMSRMVMDREREHGDAVKRGVWEKAHGMEPARLPRSMAEKVNPRQLVWPGENLLRLIEASLASHPFRKALRSSPWRGRNKPHPCPPPGHSRPHPSV